MLIAVIGIGVGFMDLERLFPGQPLPQVPGWWLRVVLINVMQAAVVMLAGYTWDHWFHGGLLNLGDWPVRDMLFGTYLNPPTYAGPCGFVPEREAAFGKMLSFRNVNNSYRRTTKRDVP